MKESFQIDQSSEPSQSFKKMTDFFFKTSIEFQFSTKEYAKKWTTAEQNEKKAEMTEWWKTAEPILCILLALPYPVFVYQVIEGLVCLVNLGDLRSLHWLKETTRAGIPAGLTNEKRAADLTIDTLGKILTEHKTSILSESQPRFDFVQILEAYLQIGWPKAIQFAIQIERVFR